MLKLLLQNVSLNIYVINNFYILGAGSGGLAEMTSIYEKTICTWGEIIFKYKLHNKAGENIYESAVLGDVHRPEIAHLILNIWFMIIF